MGVTAAWLGFALAFVPGEIQAAYEGRSIELLNDAFNPVVRLPLADYQTRWTRLAVAGAVLPWAVAWFLGSTQRGGRPVRWIGAASPQWLGWMRMVVCGILLTNLWWEDLASVTEVPVELRRPLGVVRAAEVVVPAFRHLERSPAALATLKCVTAILLAAGLVGWRTRVTIPAAAVGYFLAGGVLRTYSHLFHTCLLPFYLLVLLAFTPCGMAWSIDRLRRKATNEFDATPSLRFGWVRYVAWAIVASMYFSAGLSKLQNGGWTWGQATNLRAILYADNLSDTHFDWDGGLWLAAAPDSLFAALGYGTMAIELGFPVVLFSRTARWGASLLAVGMHLGTWLLMNLLFFDLMLLPLIFLDPHAIATRRRRAPTGQATPIGNVPSTAPDGLPVGKFVIGAAVAWTALIIIGVGRFEGYPWTAWQMYSGSVSIPETRAVNVVAHRRDGTQQRFHIERTIPALADGRFRDHLWRSKLPAHQPPLVRLLETCMARHNATCAPEDQVAAVEVQHWRYHFTDAPGPPTERELVHSLLVPQPTARDQ